MFYVLYGYEKENYEILLVMMLYYLEWNVKVKNKNYDYVGYVMYF